MTDFRHRVNLGSIPLWLVLQIDVELLVGDFGLFQSQLCLEAVAIHSQPPFTTHREACASMLTLWQNGQTLAEYNVSCSTMVQV